MRIHLVLIGPPGSGKGTQAVRLARRYRIPHVSTGDILREAVRAGSALGQQVRALMSRGELVSDELITELIGDRLSQRDARDGWLLDGYPRTTVQAEALDRMTGAAPLIVVLIQVSEEEIVRRLGSRRVCTSCGLTQSVSETDREAEACPYCGGTLARREDDDAETVRRRLATYAAFAEPLIAHYRQAPGFVAVDGMQKPDEVTRALYAEIGRMSSA